MPKFKNISYKAVPKWLVFWVIIFMLASLPTIATWLKNRYQVTIQDFTLPIILDALSAIIVTAVFYKGYKKNRLGALAGAIFVTLMIDQDFQERLGKVWSKLNRINPLLGHNGWDGAYNYLVLMLMIFGGGLIISYIIRRVSQTYKVNLDLLGNAVMVTVTAAFLIQFYSLAKVIIPEWHQFFYRPAAISTPTAKVTNKPDIYYIVLDRYTSQSVMKNQFNFDNADFMNYLNSNGFSVNSDAHSNYPYTTMSIASTLNANYNSDLVNKFSTASLQTLEPYHDSIRYASVIEKLKSFGYSFYQLGTWYEASNKAPLADYLYQPQGQLTVLGHNFNLNPFETNDLMNGEFWQIFKYKIQIGKLTVFELNPTSNKEAILYKLNNLKQISDQPAGGKFVFAHFLIPHDPYYFNPDGSAKKDFESDNMGQPIKQKYVDNVKFINSQMEEIITQIKQKSDNKAVIVVQADEGPYPAMLNSGDFDWGAVGDELDNNNMTKWPDQDLQMKYGILAAYDVPGAKKEDLAAGGDSVNIFRVIMNTYFNTKLAYLPECYYAFPNGRGQPFIYTDITARLTGQANPACPANSNFETKK